MLAWSSYCCASICIPSVVLRSNQFGQVLCVPRKYTVRDSEHDESPYNGSEYAYSLKRCLIFIRTCFISVVFHLIQTVERVSFARLTQKTISLVFIKGCVQIDVAGCDCEDR